jgi:hypothetical protein
LWSEVLGSNPGGGEKESRDRERGRLHGRPLGEE